MIPTVIALLFARDVGRRLLLGWALGFLGSVLGIVASVELDLPTGAAVVAAFGVLLALAIVLRVALRAAR